MKSMASIYHRQRAYRMTPAGKQMEKQESENIVRRQYGIVMWVLHHQFGWGPQRIQRFLSECSNFAEEAAKDELWFDTVAAWAERCVGVSMWHKDWMEGGGGK